MLEFYPPWRGDGKATWPNWDLLSRAADGRLRACDRGPLRTAYDALVVLGKRMKTIGTELGTIAGCAFIGACFGGSLGYGLGRFVPGYYRSVFPSAENPNFDPVGVGLGLGVSQGTAFGAFIGLGLVTVLALRESRLNAKHDSTSLPGVPPVHSTNPRPTLFGITFTLIVSSLLTVVGGLLGFALNMLILWLVLDPFNDNSPDRAQQLNSWCAPGMVTGAVSGGCVGLFAGWRLFWPKITAMLNRASPDEIHR
jgi:hypothetical protein